MTPAIETHALRKVYGPTVALDALDLRVEPGEVFGFLGPNGAGKTTAVKLLLGLTRPTAGESRNKIATALTMIAVTVAATIRTPELK